MIYVKNGRLGVLGDMHGWTPGIENPIKYFAKNGVKTIFQVGDFGLFPTWSSIKFFDELSARLAEHGMTIYAIRGNHDSDEWERLLREGVKDNTNHPGAYLRHNIVLMPRKGYINIKGLQRVVLAAYAGGAVSIDRNMRVPGESWWPEEELTDAEVDTMETAAEVLFTHDASNNTEWGFQLVPDPASMVHREKIDRIRAMVRPTLHFHGHMHKRFEWRDFHTQTYGLDCNGLDDSYGILDVDKLEFEFGTVAG